MTAKNIDLTTLTVKELMQLQQDAATIIAAEEATKLEVAVFCDEVRALAIQRGITMADLARAVLVAETGNNWKVQDRRTPKANYPQGDGTWTGGRFKPRWVT